MVQFNLFSKKNNTYINTLRNQVPKTLSSVPSNEPDIINNYIINNWSNTKSPQK
ncbi:MAG: hypothetical protein ACRC41_11530 [Sarcina sp.]